MRNLNERRPNEERLVVGKEDVKDECREGWRTGWRQERDNCNVFSHRFTQAIALPFSLALISRIIEQCGIPLKILLRFHKNQIASGNERSLQMDSSLIPILSREKYISVIIRYLYCTSTQT